MGTQKHRIRDGLMLLGALAPILAIQSARADETGLTVPDTLVTASRLGEGVTGASTTVITAAEIERSPGQTLQDVLARVPGIQVQSLFGGVNGTSTTVDLRGFGAAATPNTLVLINGRRLNDIDLSGIDFGSIPREGIERIEITRGNSGAVLYGDGAVGGGHQHRHQERLQPAAVVPRRGSDRLVRLQGNQRLRQPRRRKHGVVGFRQHHHVERLP